MQLPGRFDQSQSLGVHDISIEKKSKFQSKAATGRVTYPGRLCLVSFCPRQSNLQQQMSGVEPLLTYSGRFFPL